jgi:transposase
MIDELENEKDIKFVKLVARTLYSSNILLQEEIKRLKSQMSDSDQMRFDLNDKLTILRKRFFEKGSEKLIPALHGKNNQKLLPHNRPPVTMDTELKSELLKIEEFHYIGGDCPNCGDDEIEKIKNQFEDSVEIDVIERTYTEILHRRQKYRCKCCETIVTAPGQEKLRAGTKYSIDLAVNIAVDKFSYHLPLERIERQMREVGLKIDSKQLYSLTEMLYINLEGIAEKIKNEILNYGYVHIDETRGKILRTNTNGYIWAISNKFGAYFQFETTRSGLVAEEMLKGFSGVIISDGFSGYNRFSKNKNSKISVSNCWAHARRKFMDVKEDYPMAEEYLLMVQSLYAIEHEADDFESLKYLRRDRSIPIIEKIFEWLIYHKDKTFPRSGIGKAVRYSLSLWEGLTRFLEDPMIPLDNNTAERSLRNPVKGRDNYNGYMSINGADTAMFFYTIIETCKLINLNPRRYLSAMARAHWKKQDLQSPLEYAQMLNKERPAL